MSLLVSSCRMSSSSSKSVVEFSMATYLLEMEKRLQAAQTISEQRMVDSQTISEQRIVDSRKDLKEDLQAAQTISEQRMVDSQKDLKKDLQAAQTISEQRMVDSQKQQIYKIVFLGASVGFTAFTIFEIGMRVFGYGITKLG